MNTANATTSNSPVNSFPQYSPAYKEIVEKTRSGNAAIVYGRIYFWFMENKKTGKSKLRIKIDEILALAKTAKELADETGLTVDQVKKAIAILRKHNLVFTTTKLFKRIRTLHFSLVPFVPIEQIESADLHSINPTTESVNRHHVSADLHSAPPQGECQSTRPLTVNYNCNSKLQQKQKPPTPLKRGNVCFANRDKNGEEREAAENAHSETEGEQQVERIGSELMKKILASIPVHSSPHPLEPKPEIQGPIGSYPNRDRSEGGPGAAPAPALTIVKDRYRPRLEETSLRERGLNPRALGRNPKAERERAEEEARKNKDLKWKVVQLRYETETATQPPRISLTQAIEMGRNGAKLKDIEAAMFNGDPQ